MSIEDEQFEYELDQKDLQGLLKYGNQRKLKKGEPVFQAGDDPDSLWFVRSGRIHMNQTGADGRESMVSFYTGGKTFCMAAMLIDRPYPCTATAGADSSLIAVPANRFKALFDKLPAFARRMLKEMAPQFCESHCNCAMSVEAVDKRLAATLLRLDRQFGGGAIPFTRQELAQMVNTTVETCIRVLSKWTKQGVLKGRRGKVHVVNHAALQETISDLSL